MTSLTHTGKGAENESNGTYYQMTLRTDRPIESCELSPYPFLYLKGGTLDNASRQKKMDSNPHKFSFRWFRGPKRQICQNADCPRGSTCDPVYWSRAAIGGSSLNCIICEKAGVIKHLSFFCSAGCFKAAWRDHRCKHSQIDASVSTESPTHISDKDSVLQNIDSSNTVPNVSITAMNEDSWVAIGINKEYVPTADDVGCVLRVEVSATAINDGKLLAGPMISFTDHVLSTPRGPPLRNLITIPSTVPISSTGARFRVISYNILAELYATKQAYPYCDSWSLSWPFRRAMIQQELEETQGDIVCLQEVQADHYEQHLNPFMQTLGYDSMYKQKSRESMGGYGKVDGCATFWRRTKFIMVENYAVEFNDCAREAAAALGLDDSECRKYMNRLSRDNVAQLFIFEVVTRGANATGVRRQMSHLCVVNTHIYSNHTRPDVKLWQSIALMREVENVAVARDVAVLVCGDFNSEPDSAVHEFMAGGALQQPHPELEQSDNLGILPDTHEITHCIELASVMESGLGAEPQFTNYTANFKGTLDYIWYTPGRLRVLAITNVPDEGEIYESSGEGLPSAVYPSDHVMLCADIAFSISDTGNVTRALAHRRNGVHRERDSGRDNSNRENGREKSRNTRNSNNNGR